MLKRLISQLLYSLTCYFQTNYYWKGIQSVCDRILVRIEIKHHIASQIDSTDFSLIVLKILVRLLKVELSPTKKRFFFHLLQ